MLPDFVHSALAHHLVESPDGVLLEVGSVAVRFEGFAVLVLLVDEHRIGIIFDPMRDVGNTAGFLAGRRGQFFEYLGNLLAVFVGEAHAYCEGDHKFEGSGRKYDKSFH